MSDLSPTNLSRDDRCRLAKMCIRLLDLWGLSRRQQFIMLGISPNYLSRLRSFSQGKPLPHQPEMLDRAGLLMGIAASLELLFPENPELFESWALTPDGIVTAKWTGVG